jgi:hypothetical protein
MPRDQHVLRSTSDPSLTRQHGRKQGKKTKKEKERKKEE